MDEAILGTPDHAGADRKLHALTDFGGLYVRHRGALIVHARRFLSDPHDIDDVVQETFLKLFLAMPEVETEGQALAFARRVLTNLCIDRYRVAKRRPATVDLDLGSTDYLLAEEEPTDPVVQAEDAAIIREALSLLTPLHREALIKREIEEKPLPVIAEELGIPEESVKHLLFRARRMLRRLLVGTSVDPATTMTAPEVLAAANQRLARAALRSTNVIIALLVAVVAVAGGVHGISRSTTATSDAVGPGTSPVPTSPGHRTRQVRHHSGKSHGSAPVAHRGAAGASAFAPVTITGPTPSRPDSASHPVRHPGAGGSGHGPTTPPVAGSTSPQYVVAGSVKPTGPVAIDGQQRVNYGTTSATSVSQLAAPVGGAHFVMGQALISTSSAPARMQLDPQVQDASGAASDLPVASTSTTESIDPTTLNHAVEVTATLQVGNSPGTPATLSIEMTYDPAMQHVLAETVTASNLDLTAPLVPVSAPPASGPGATGSATPSDTGPAGQDGRGVDSEAPASPVAGDPTAGSS